MPKYRVLVKSFVNNGLVDEGAVIDYDGEPSSNLEALDKPAEQAAEGAKSANTRSAARQRVAAAGASPDDINTVAAANAAAAAAAEVLAKAAAGAPAAGAGDLV
jgi:hypothetical protein